MIFDSRVELAIKDGITTHIASVIRQYQYKTVGICGPSGSGKTTFAKALQQALGEDSMILKVDSYWQYTRSEMAERNLTGYDWATRDKPLFLADLTKLKSGQSIEKPVFDYVKEMPAHQTVSVAPRDIIILEDTLDFSGLVDLMIFIYAPDDVLISRRLSRDAHKTGFGDAETLENYLKTKSIPAYRKGLLPVAEKADYIINTDSSRLYAKSK